MALPEPNYKYQPVYGVEPWEQNGQLFSDIAATVPVANGQFGGGAKVTAQNLIVSLWWVETTKDLDGLDVPASGSLLIPRIEFGNVDPPAAPAAKVDVVKSRKQEFLSRITARFLINLFDIPQATPWTLLAVLNPPPGMKERLARATEYTKSGANVVGSSKKSLVDSVVWDVASWQTTGGTTPLGWNEDTAQWTPGQADTYAAGSNASQGGLPLLKTNGANGVYPEFFGGTADEILAEQEARNAGNFFVPMEVVLSPDPATDSSVVTIKWPHSIARG